MNAAIYARVSSERQEVDLSISAQLKELRKAVQKDGNTVVNEFVDEAESGRSDDRPAFRKMINHACKQSRPFDVIYVWNFSRFARDRHDSIVNKKLLHKFGVELISVKEPIEDTPSGKFYEGIIECVDEFYSARIGEDVMRGMRESASRGFYVASHVPYGYRKTKVQDNGRDRYKLVIEPDEAVIVKRVFNEIIQGKGMTEVVKALNNDGISAPRGEKWGKTTIHGMLRNETYTGKLIWCKTSSRKQEPLVIDNAWPFIIEKPIFEKVQQLLKGRAREITHPRRVVSSFLLSGILKCGYCGKALIGHDAKSGKFSYYTCGTKLKRGAKACPAHYYNSKNLEQHVIDVIKEHILDEGNLRELIHLVNEKIDKTTCSCKEQVETINHQINDIKRRLERLYDAIERGTITDHDVAPRIRELMGKKEDLERKQWELEWQIKDRKIEMTDFDLITSYMKDLKYIFEQSASQHKKVFIRSFVREIEVLDDKATMSYTLPIIDSLTKSEETLVLSTVQYGGPLWTRTTDPGLIRTVL
jgi:site-specific DNA recombinase